MSTLIGKQFAMYDVPKMPSADVLRDGKVYRFRKMLISPYTTGEPILILQTTFYADPNGKLMDAETLDKYGHAHEFAEEIMIFDKAAKVVADGVMYDVPAGGAFIAKAKCRHGCQFVDKTQDGTITCIFVPTIPADEDPVYVSLIQKTKEYLAGSDVVRL